MHLIKNKIQSFSLEILWIFLYVIFSFIEYFIIMEILQACMYPFDAQFELCYDRQNNIKG